MVLDRWGGRDATEWNRSDPKEPANRLSAEVNQHIQTSKMRKTVGTTVSYLLTKGNVFSSNTSASYRRIEKILNFTSERSSNFTCL